MADEEFEPTTATSANLAATNDIAPDAADPGATNFVLEIPADVVVHYAGYGYAAHYQVRLVRKGTYPVRQTTIHGRKPFPPPGADKTAGRPYWVTAWVPAEVVTGHADLEPAGTQIRHFVQTYYYNLNDGYAAVYGHARGLPLDTRLEPAGWFRMATPTKATV